MASGERIARMVEMIAGVVMEGIEAQHVRQLLVREVIVAQPLMHASVVNQRIDTEIGYAAGYLPPDMANVALQAFNVEHPYFGKTIPDYTAAWQAGIEAGNKYAEQRAETEAAQHAAKITSELGVTMPVMGDAVNGDDAQAVLDALRKKKAAKYNAKMATAASVGDWWADDNGDTYVYSGTAWELLPPGADLAKHITSLTNKTAGDW